MNARRVLLRLLLSVFLGCTTLGATAQGPTDQERKFPLQVQFWSLGGDLSANLGTFVHAGEYVIDDAAQFQALWQRAFVRPYGMPEEAPYIDFANETVIVLAMGQWATGGHSIRAESVTEYDAAVQVVYASRSVGGNCMVTQGATSPVEIIRIKRRAKPIKFHKKKRASDCKP